MKYEFPAILMSAAFCTLGLIADIALATLFLTKLANVLWVSRRPIPWQHRFVIRFSRKQLLKNVVHVTPHV